MENNINISVQDLDNIEKYLLDQLTAAEKANFEVQLSINQDLKNKTNELRLLFTGISEQALRTKLAHFHAKMDKPTAQASVFSLKKITLAALVIVLAGTGIWYLSTMPSPEQKLFSTYYKPDPGLITAMSSSDNYAFERAMIDYKRGNYEAALNAWTSQLSESPSNDTLLYFIGSAHLALENTEKAIPFFIEVTKQPKSIFYQETLWYLGLCYLKTGQPEKAKLTLNQTSHKQREPLLESLQKLNEE